MQQRVFLQRKTKELLPEEEEWMLEAKPINDHNSRHHNLHSWAERPLGNRCRRKPGGPPLGSSAWLRGLLDWSQSPVRIPRSASPSSSDPQDDFDGLILWASFYLRFSLGGPGGAQLPSCSCGQWWWRFSSSFWNLSAGSSPGTNTAPSLALIAKQAYLHTKLVIRIHASVYHFTHEHITVDFMSVNELSCCICLLLGISWFYKYILDFCWRLNNCLSTLDKGNISNSLQYSGSAPWFFGDHYSISDHVCRLLECLE